MLHFWSVVWSVAAISVVALHYQQKHGALGKSRETFLIALAYTILCYQIFEHKLTFLTALHIDVTLWCMYVVTLFNRRYETLDDEEE